MRIVLAIFICITGNHVLAQNSAGTENVGSDSLRSKPMEEVILSASRVGPWDASLRL